MQLFKHTFIWNYLICFLSCLYLFFIMCCIYVFVWFFCILHLIFSIELKDCGFCLRQTAYFFGSNSTSKFFHIIRLFLAVSLTEFKSCCRNLERYAGTLCALHGINFYNVTAREGDKLVFSNIYNRSIFLPITSRLLFLPVKKWEYFDSLWLRFI